MSQSIPPAGGARVWIQEIASLVSRADCYVLELGELDSAVKAVNDALAGGEPGATPSRTARVEE
jgi:hypothetical protein